MRDPEAGFRVALHWPVNRSRGVEPKRWSAQSAYWRLYAQRFFPYCLLPGTGHARYMVNRDIAVFGVGALIYTPIGRYLMQLRDDKPGVSMRGYWGLFGGTIESGESPRQALARELREELALSIETPAIAFTELTYSLEFASNGTHRKIYYEVQIQELQVNLFRLGEGQQMALHTPEEVAFLPNVIPWDLFGVLMHARRGNIREVLARRLGSL